MLQFSITTLGCKVNQYDGCAVAALLARGGMERVAPNRRASLVVVNTCCVTATARRKSRQAIRKAVRLSPDAAVLIIGCYVTYDAEAIRTLLADLGTNTKPVALAGHYDDVSDCIIKLLRNISAQQGELHHCSSRGDSSATIKTRRKQAVAENAPGTRNLPPIKTFDGHQRAFVKVQDGCDAFCSYCIVCYTRPMPWFRPIEQIHRECVDLVRGGHREIVLSGVFLGAYGRSTAVRKNWSGGSGGLVELVKRISAIEGLWRLRLSSLEAGDLDDELLEVCRSLPNVAPHFHLPLQSGSPAILSRMNRQYTVDEYRRTIARLREAMDRPAITTDIIVGFPGESDADFDQTLAVAQYAGFSKIHIFPFSPIEGTAAWSYRDESPPTDVVKSRISRLKQLAERMASDYRRQFVGETVQALVESGARAMTDRYMTVNFQCPDGAEGLVGKVVTLRIDGESSGVIQST